MAASATLLEPWPLARQPRARQKPACSTNCVTLHAAVASMASALHCTAPHSTAPHGRMRHEMHLCTLSFHFLARFARVLVLTAATCVCCEFCFMSCGRWQSEAWRARSVWRFWRSARRKHESLLCSKHAARRMPSGRAQGVRAPPCKP